MVDHVQQLKAKMRKHEQQMSFPDATEEVRSGDGQLTVRARPASPKRQPARESISADPTA